jgi:hypothetical protein
MPTPHNQKNLVVTLPQVATIMNNDKIIMCDLRNNQTGDRTSRPQGSCLQVGPLIFRVQVLVFKRTRIK